MVSFYFAKFQTNADVYPAIFLNCFATCSSFHLYLLTVPGRDLEVNYIYARIYLLLSKDLAARRNQKSSDCKFRFNSRLLFVLLRYWIIDWESFSFFLNSQIFFHS